MFKRNHWLRKILCIALVLILLTGCADGIEERRARSDGYGVTPTAEVTPTGEVTPGEVTPTAEPTGEVTPTEIPVTPTEIPVTPTEVPATPTPEVPTPTGEVTPVPTGEVTPVPGTPTPTPKDNKFETIEEEQAAFDKFLDDVFVFLLGTDNLTVHFTLEHPEKYGIKTKYELKDEEFDIQKSYREFKEACAPLADFTYEHLTKAQQVNYDRIVYELDLSERYKDIDIKSVNNYLMAEASNSLSNLLTALTEYPLVEKKDLDDYIKDIEATADYLDSLYALMKKLCENGAYPTQDMFDTTLDNIDTLCEDKDNVIVAAFRANAEVAGFDADTVSRYTSLVADTVNKKLVPAAEAMYENVYSLQSYVTDVKGLASKEGGANYYTFLAQSKTGSNLTVDEMYDYLIRKSEEMVGEYRAWYLADVTILKRYQSAKYDTRDFDTILKRLMRFTEQEYPAIRKTTYTVSKLPDELCVSSVLAYYMSPQVDCVDRKIIRVNPKSGQNSVSLFSTLAHEGYPGHLYQDEYFLSTEGYHPINAVLSYVGYAEGWATMMGKNAYKWACEDDAVAFLFDFDYTYTNTVVAICDIGVNYYNWDKKQVADYLKTTMLINGASLASLVYGAVVSDPGVYLPYTYSHFQCLDIINALVATGKTEKEAYQAFLEVGPASMDVLCKHLGFDGEPK